MLIFSSMRKILAILLVLLFSSCDCLLGADKPDEINFEIQRAMELSDLRHSQMPPFRLSATVTLTLSSKGPLQGKYNLLRNSDGQWREELTMPGYSRLRVGDAHNYWQLRSSEYDPLSILNIDELIDFPRYLNREKTRKFSKPSNTKKEGMDVSCQHPKVDAPHQETICFYPSSGELAYIDNGMSGIQSADRVSLAIFSEFREIAGKRFPIVIKGFGGKRLLVDIHVDELGEAPDLVAGLFVTPAGASQWLYCASPAESKLKNRISPDYPRASRGNREQGAVTFYAVIGVDGKILRLFKIQSASAALDKSSVVAVSQWIYDQPICAGVLAPVETTIDVIFTLQY
jgi:hypothetical protein